MLDRNSYIMVSVQEYIYEAQFVSESKFYYAMLSKEILPTHIYSSKECLQVQMQGQWDLQGDATTSAMTM